MQIAVRSAIVAMRRMSASDPKRTFAAPRHWLEPTTVGRPRLPSAAITAGIIGESRRVAGLALLRKGNPDNWQKLIDDTTLVTANRDNIDSCRPAAVKSKRRRLHDHRTAGK
jgi:Family of unknown function (DUF6118)